MKRLFVRIYLAVTAAVTLTALATGLVLVLGRFQNDVSVTERALRGGIRLARDEVQRAGAVDSPERAAVLEDLEERFGYPVIVRSLEDDVTQADRVRLERNEVVLLAPGYDRIAQRLGTQRLELGPMPEYELPDWELLIMLALLLVICGVPLILLVQRLHRQLRHLRAQLEAFSAGDRDARIDVAQAQDLRGLADVLNTTIGSASQALRTQQELLQAVSHELRSPLARLRFGIALLMDEYDPETRAFRLGQLDHSVVELDGLVSELLEFVRAPASSGPEVVLLQPIITELLARTGVGNDIDIRQENAHSSSGLSVLAETRDMQRFFSNILENARRYASREIVLSARKTGNTVVVTVDDDGPGIAADVRQSMLQPFGRAEDSPGVGLGLAIASRIARRWKGQLHIEDSPLGGCRVRLELPAA